MQNDYTKTLRIPKAMDLHIRTLAHQTKRSVSQIYRFAVEELIRKHQSQQIRR